VSQNDETETLFDQFGLLIAVTAAVAFSIILIIVCVMIYRRSKGGEEARKAPYIVKEKTCATERKVFENGQNQMITTEPRQLPFASPNEKN